MREKRPLPVPRTATDAYLAAIFGRLGDLLDRFPAPPPVPGAAGGGVEIREPVASPGAPVPGASPPALQPATEPDPAPEPEPEPAVPDEPEPEPEPVEPEPSPPAEEAPGEPDGADGAATGPPSVRAAKQAWINYATARGLDEDDAHAMTKQELIARYRG